MCKMKRRDEEGASRRMRNSSQYRALPQSDHALLEDPCLDCCLCVSEARSCYAHVRTYALQAPSPGLLIFTWLHTDQLPIPYQVNCSAFRCNGGAGTSSCCFWQGGHRLCHARSLLGNIIVHRSGHRPSNLVRTQPPPPGHTRSCTHARRFHVAIDLRLHCIDLHDLLYS